MNNNKDWSEYVLLSLGGSQHITRWDKNFRVKNKNKTLNEIISGKKQRATHKA